MRKISLLVMLVLSGCAELTAAKMICLPQEEGNHLVCIIPSKDVKYLEQNREIFCAREQEDGPDIMVLRSKATYCRKFIKKVPNGFLVQDFYTTGQKLSNAFIIENSEWLGFVSFPNDCQIPIDGSLMYYDKKGKMTAKYMIKNQSFISKGYDTCD